MVKKLLLVVFFCAYSLGAAADEATITITSSGKVTMAAGGYWPFGDGPFEELPYSVALRTDFVPYFTSNPPPGVGYGPNSMTLTIGEQTLTFEGIDSQRLSVRDNESDSSGGVGDSFFYEAFIPIAEDPFMSGGFMVVSFVLFADDGYLSGTDPLAPRTMSGPFNLAFFSVDSWRPTGDTIHNSYSMSGRPETATITIASAIPEPAQSSLMIIGLLAVAALGYRKAAR